MEERASLINNPGGIAPVFSLEWEYPIWQLRFDDVTGLIAVECRDADSLQTSFGVFKGITGKVVLQSYKPVKAWWKNLADIRAGIMYLQGVAAKGVGKSVGIFAVDATNGQEKWELPEYSFYGLTPTEVLVLPGAGESTDLTGIQVETGKETNTSGSIAEMQKRITSFRQQRFQTLQVPQQYPTQSAYFPDLQAFIKSKTGLTAQGAIDYLEFNNTIAIGFQPLLENNQLTYQLALFSMAGDIYLHENLGKDLAGIGTDSFFIFQDTLILLKNRNSLLGYKV